LSEVGISLLENMPVERRGMKHSLAPALVQGVGKI
jgi:hypothetical protein